MLTIVQEVDFAFLVIVFTADSYDNLLIEWDRLTTENPNGRYSLGI